MSTIRQFALTVLCSAFAVTFVTAQEPKPSEKPAPVTKEAPKAVFVIANVHGKHEVMNKEALEAKNKQAAEEHAKAMEAFKKEKQAVEASGKKHEAKEPKKVIIETTGTEYPSKAAADEALKKMEEEEAKKKNDKKEPPK